MLEQLIEYYFTLGGLTKAVRLPPAASLSAELLALPRLRRRSEYPEVLVLIARYELLCREREMEEGPIALFCPANCEE